MTRFQIVARFKNKKSKWKPLYANKATYKTKTYANRKLREQEDYYPELSMKVVAIAKANRCRLCGK